MQLNGIKGLEKLSSVIREDLPEKAKPLHERDPKLAAITALYDLYTACQKARIGSLPPTVYEATKSTTAMLGRTGLMP